MSKKNQVDPYECGDALRDALLRGGASPREADREAEKAIRQAEKYNASPDNYRLHRK